MNYLYKCINSNKIIISSPYIYTQFLSKFQQKSFQVPQETVICRNQSVKLKSVSLKIYNDRANRNFELNTL